MSSWTHIVACIYIDTNIQDFNIKEIMEEILKDAPQITGREGHADIFINLLNGHNMYTSHDCNHCPFSHTKKHAKEGFYCNAPSEYKCKEASFQTCVAITIVGNLRDRLKEQTREEYKFFLKWLKERFEIENHCYKITNK